MPVVSNTSPILNLAVIGLLDLLRIQFGQILIPTEVRTELKADTELSGARNIRQALSEGWMREIKVADKALYHSLALELDNGEAAAITCALEQKIGTILMDEHDGRAKARALGLQPLGILGVLLRAKKDGQIPSVKDAMLALRRDAGFFIDDELYQSVLNEAKER